MKRHRPAEVRHQKTHQRKAEHQPQRDAQRADRVGFAALVGGEMIADVHGLEREQRPLADAKQRAHHAQQHQRSRQRRGGGEQRPQHHAQRQRAAVPHQRFQKRRQQHGGQAVAEQKPSSACPVGAVAAELEVLQEVGIDQHHGDIDPIRIGDNDQKQQGDHPKPALTLLHVAFLNASG